MSEKDKIPNITGKVPFQVSDAQLFYSVPIADCDGPRNVTTNGCGSSTSFASCECSSVSRGGIFWGVLRRRVKGSVQWSALHVLTPV